MNKIVPLVCLVVLLSTICNAQVNVQTDFPGGNIVVDSIVKNELYLKPDQKGHDTTKTPWFYWSFKATSLYGGNTHFVFNHDNPLTRKGPAISTDSGKTWKWLFADTDVDTSHFSYRMPVNKEVWFSMSIPYTSNDFKEFLSNIDSSFDSYYKLDTALVLKSGRALEILKINFNCSYPEYTVFLFSRHHACESSASFVVDGMVQKALEYSKQNDFVKNHVRFIVFPFMDLDGVENGEQGKDREPHDHNRDYLHFIYESTKYFRDNYTEFAEGTKVFCLDNHAPYIKWKQNETIFFVGQERADINEKLKTMASFIEENDKSGLNFKKEWIFDFDKEWNSRTISQSRQDRLMKNSQWCQIQENNFFASTLEVSYANVGGVAWSTKQLKQFGNAVMMSVFHLLERDADEH